MQERSRQTRQRIVEGMIAVLASEGVAGVTHRAVAEAAGVSLAATTRHFDTKQDMLTETSESVLQDYLGGFENLLARLRGGQLPALSGLGDIVERAVLGGLFRERRRSLAWCELILHGGRSAEGRAIARRWYAAIDEIWTEIAAAFAQRTTRAEVAAAVDRTVGMLFLLHPTGLTSDQVTGLIRKKLFVSDLLAQPAGQPTSQDARGAQDGAARILGAAMDVLAHSGPQAVSYRAVSEVAGMSRGAPGYHFPTVESLLEAAQIGLFERAKDRYRRGIRGYSAQSMSPDELADLTTAIFYSEAMQHASENLAFYSTWIRAAEQPRLRPAIFRALRELQTGWVTVLRQADLPGVNAFDIHALFIGKLARAIGSGADIQEMARSREQILASITG